jgi:DNA-binding MarR family transcriptional regulator
MTSMPQLSNTYRRYLASVVLFHLAAAEEVGLSPTDYQAINILEMQGFMTSGELGKRLGLTTGAATRAIDRLVLAGYARRTSDPKDRRRVVIESTELLPRNLAGLLGLVREPIAGVVKGLDPIQQAGLFEYLEGAARIYEHAAVTIRTRKRNEATSPRSVAG